MLSFKLISKCFQESHYPNDDVDFLIEENDWNDFSYYTTYHLHATKKLTRDKVEYLGPFNIIKTGQIEGERYLLRKIFGDTPFNSLPDGFVSISFSVDLYKALYLLLDKENRSVFIDSLHLILSLEDDYYRTVKEDSCFIKSALRSADMNDFGLSEGRRILRDDANQYYLREKEIVVKYNDAKDPIHLKFNSLKINEGDGLPSGSIAFIGKNGSGKSTFLYKLANLIYAHPKSRSKYADRIGTISPSDIGISQLIILSYNPFDNFSLPGSNNKNELQLWANNIEKRKGRFLYCGMRDVKAEAEYLIEEYTKIERDKGINDSGEPSYSVRVDKITLKSNKCLSKEAEAAYDMIRFDTGKSKEWEEIRQDLKCFFPELYTIEGKLGWSLLDSSWNQVFNSLSTGHKYFFHSLLHILAYCETNALIMFDEPENHLQSPLLAFLVHEINRIIERRKAVMLIATHSPVVLQEMMSENVRIVSWDGEFAIFRKPTIETYGETISAISSEVFGLNTDRVYFNKTLRSVFSKLSCSEMRSASEAVEKVVDAMGGISSQGIHLVVSEYLMEHQNK